MGIILSRVRRGLHWAVARGVHAVFGLKQLVPEPRSTRPPMPFLISFNLTLRLRMLLSYSCSCGVAWCGVVWCGVVCLPACSTKAVTRTEGCLLRRQPPVLRSTRNRCAILYRATFHGLACAAGVALDSALYGAPSL